MEDPILPPLPADAPEAPNGDPTAQDLAAALWLLGLTLLS